MEHFVATSTIIKILKQTSHPLRLLFHIARCDEAQDFVVNDVNRILTAPVGPVSQRWMSE